MLKKISDQVLGLMCALDPHVHKRNQQSLQGPLGDGTRTTNDAGPHIQSSDELPMDLWPSFTTSEDYFSTVSFLPKNKNKKKSYLLLLHLMLLILLINEICNV